MQLSPEQLKQFADAGVVKLEGLLAPSVTQTLLDEIQAGASEHGMYRDGDWHCEPAAWPAAAPDWAKKATQDALPSVETEIIQSVVDQLMAGIPQHRNYQSAQLLFTLPNGPQWTVPHSMWHLDMPRLNDGSMPGVQMFAMIDDVLPGGGGTLVVAGSHRLINDEGYVKLKEVKKKLLKYDFFEQLLSADDSIDRNAFLSPGMQADEVALQVIELCGSRGDVFFTDLRVLHTLSRNAREQPRIMATRRFHSTAAEFTAPS